MAGFYKKGIETVPGEQMTNLTVGTVNINPDTLEYLGNLQLGWSLANELDLRERKLVTAKADVIHSIEMHHSMAARHLMRRTHQVRTDKASSFNREDELLDLLATKLFLEWWQQGDGSSRFWISPTGLEFEDEEMQDVAYSFLWAQNATPSHGLTFKEGMDNNWSCQQGPWCLSVLGPMIGTDSKEWYWRIYLTLPSKQVVLFASHGDYDVNAFASRAEAEADMMDKWNKAKADMGVK